MHEESRGRNRYLFADVRRTGLLLRELEGKVRGTGYDATGLRELATVCGGA